jgi:hypothetical protein
VSPQLSIKQACFPFPLAGPKNKLTVTDWLTPKDFVLFNGSGVDLAEGGGLLAGAMVGGQGP